MPNIRRETLDEGFFLLLFDRADAGPNRLDFDTLAELEGQLDALASPEHQVKGLIIASARPDSFISGTDLAALRRMNTEEVKTCVQRGQSVFNKLAALPFPTVAAVQGPATGGGYELCLACDWRVAASDPGTVLGLPETRLGLIPAWGGCTRLPRLLSVPKALDVILGAQVLPARQALRAGLVDEVVPREHVRLAARRWLDRGKHPQSLARSAAVNAMVDAVIAPGERHEVRQKTHGNFPAVEKALEVVLKGSASWDVADAFERERDALAELAGSETTRQLLHLHFAQEKARTYSVPDAPAAPAGFRRAAVIGAGALGSGIAQHLSAHGLPVILRDDDQEQLAHGVGNIAGLFAAAARQRTCTEREARAGRDRVSPAATEVPLRQVDVVIEAASETLEAAKTSLQRLEKVVRPDAVLAINSPLFPLGPLAAANSHPPRVVGLHFFNPVHKMQLVEVVAGPETAPEVAQRAVRLVQRLGKLPVLVKDGPGFLVNRIQVFYLAEAAALFWAGSEIKEIDGAMREFGLPMGPLRLIDEMGAEVALEVSVALASAFPERLHVPDVLPALQGTGLLGRRVGKGFYKYRRGSEASPNKDVAKLRPPGELRSLARADIELRLTRLLINEAARCLEERIVGTAGEVDLAMVMGAGFAPFLGGPLRFADSLAVTRVADELTHLAEIAGPHYAPCALLRDMAKSGKRFYED